jgi:uncharacterized protein (DUF1499 family)
VSALLRFPFVLQPGPRLEAPVFAGVTPDALRDAFFTAARAAPRVTYVGVAAPPHDANDASATHVFVQRSLLFQFPDVLHVQFRRAAPGAGATLCVHSTSVFGEGDLGVNAARVDAWLADTQARLALAQQAQR